MAFYSYTSLHPQITLIIFFIIIISSASFSFSATPNGTTVGHFTKIFAFGDSFTDTGNTRSETGPNGFLHVSNLPYGMTFFHHPTNRYSDGRLVIDFVSEYLSLPYLPPYLNQKADTSHGVNFAVAGSTSINHNFFVKNNMSLDVTPQSIQTQLDWFKKFLETHGCRPGTTSPKCKAILNDALFWVGEIGVNDYAYTITSSVSMKSIQNLVVKGVTGFLQELLSIGAKYIVVQGTPPTGCLPLAMTLASIDDRDDLGCVASANKITYTHNSLLQIKIQELRRQYPHAVISYANYWKAYRRVLKTTNYFRFKEPFKACCGTGGDPYNFDVFTTCGSPGVTGACMNPAQFINWDGVHLTEAMYKVVADLFLHGRYSYPPFDFLLRSKRQEG